MKKMIFLFVPFIISSFAMAIDESCSYGGSNARLRVARIQERKVFLQHGSLAVLGGAVVKPLSGSSLVHTWVEIETEDSGIWFCAQFGSKPDPKIKLTEHSSRYDVSQEGIRVGGRSGDDPTVMVTEDFYFRDRNITMNDVYKWMSDYNSSYNLLYNNC